MDRIIEDADGQPVVARSLIDELHGIRTDNAAGFSRLTVRLDTLERRTTALEAWRHDSDTSARAAAQADGMLLSRRQKFWGGVGIVALAAASITGPLIAVLAGGH